MPIGLFQGPVRGGTQPPWRKNGRVQLGPGARSLECQTKASGSYLAGHRSQEFFSRGQNWQGVSVQRPGVCMCDSWNRRLEASTTPRITVTKRSQERGVFCPV